MCQYFGLKLCCSELKIIFYNWVFTITLSKLYWSIFGSSHFGEAEKGRK